MKTKVIIQQNKNGDNIAGDYVAGTSKSKKKGKQKKKKENKSKTKIQISFGDEDNIGGRIIYGDKVE